MRIKVGSKNAAKVEAVKQTIQDYNFLKAAEVIGVEVNSDVSSHPCSLEEIVRGARTRAKKAFHDCEYSVGFEGGLIEVPHSNTGYMEISACAVYDGKRYAMGLSSGFEWPIEVTRLILAGIEGSDALIRAGLTTHPRLGNTPGGGIGLLTQNRVSRIGYTIQSLQMALIQLEFSKYY